MRLCFGFADLPDRFVAVALVLPACFAATQKVLQAD